YNAGRWGSTRTVVVALLLGAGAVPLASLANPDTEPGWLLLGFDALVVIALIAIGLLIRSNKDAKEQRALAETLEERNRLANDIHDSFAHHMSAIAVRAEAARQLDDPAALDEALTAIKRSASTGLADMRHLVAGLRTPDNDARPLPGFGDMQHLASELSTEALAVDLAIDAQPELIPVSTSAVAYWITREALTNVSRHATGATRATVRARGTDRHLDLTITDDGATPSVPEITRGHGLRSMTERARSLGGELSAGPNPKGGWLVSARLPLNRGDV
ncbi:MAG: sensor histidine kinase, partial [Acidimicrobiales bacterium]